MNGLSPLYKRKTQAEGFHQSHTPSAHHPPLWLAPDSSVWRTHFLLNLIGGEHRMRSLRSLSVQLTHCECVHVRLTEQRDAELIGAFLFDLVVWHAVLHRAVEDWFSIGFNRPHEQRAGHGVQAWGFLHHTRYHICFWERERDKIDFALRCLQVCEE